MCQRNDRNLLKMNTCYMMTFELLKIKQNEFITIALNFRKNLLATVHLHYNLVTTHHYTPDLELLHFVYRCMKMFLFLFFPIDKVFI